MGTCVATNVGVVVGLLLGVALGTCVRAVVGVDEAVADGAWVVAAGGVPGSAGGCWHVVNSPIAAKSPAHTATRCFVFMLAPGFHVTDPCHHHNLGVLPRFLAVITTW